MKFPVYLAVLLCTVCAVHSWENKWDQRFTYICRAGWSIRKITSYHSNHYEDRRWSFDCVNTGAKSGCSWSGYVNSFDDPVLYQCKHNGVITGISSYHKNQYKDRRFRFLCCFIPGKTLRNCRFTDEYQNAFDRYLDYYVPSYKVLKGAFSYHSNQHEDRRWKFEVCDKP